MLAVVAEIDRIDQAYFERNEEVYIDDYSKIVNPLQSIFDSQRLKKRTLFSTMKTCCLNLRGIKM
jgi:hypothetical protein